MKTIKQTPVLLLTGYLGSGKTTLVNRILTNKKGIQFAVIVNDIGEVNIDANLIEKGGIVGGSDDSLMALQNGCICCTLQTDLVEQLSSIINQKRFDYIVIEASGICDPAPIAQTIESYPIAYPQHAKNGIAKLDSIVTVVDVLRLRDEFASGNNLLQPGLPEDDIANLVIKQIEFCNIILLNKINEVTTSELNEVKAIIRSLQPSATIMECNYADVDLDLLLHTNGFDFEKVATSATWIDEIEHHHHHEHGEHCEHCHHGEAYEYGIDTFVYQQRAPFDLTLFDNFVAKQWPKGVIRCKGICYFHDETDRCYIFEQAGKQVQIRDAGMWYATMPAEELAELMAKTPALRQDWDEKYGDRMQKLVFIGQHIHRDEIIKMLDACLKE